ncbi:MAG: hypothetical protein ACYCYI_03880 [Saccharofermentanales bacterium]
MKNRMFYRLAMILIVIALLLTSTVSCKSKIEANTIEQNLVGYIIDAHCFVKNLVPSIETKECLLIDECAATGYGIAVLQSGTTYKFYFFDGKFAPDATGGQSMAHKLINSIIHKDSIIVSVSGSLIRKTIKTSDGNFFPVIKVTEISEQGY